MSSKINKIFFCRKKSPLIVAIDREPQIEIMNFLENVTDNIAGVKIGLPYLLSPGINHIREIVDEFKDNYFFIADLKLADIGYVSHIMLSIAEKIGFDAVIAHGFIGLEGALDEIKKTADSLNLFLFIVAAMSHPGAEDLLNKNVDKILEICNKISVRGFVAPATMPSYIKRIKERYSDAIIISPGIGAQGAPIGSALKAGATFEIVGRRITLSSDPVAEVKNIVQVYEELGLI